MRRLAPALVLAVAVVPLLSGCGAQGLEKGYSVQAALHELPYQASSTKQPALVVTADLDRATTLGKLKRPTSDQATGQWALGLNTKPVFVAAPRNLAFPSMGTGAVRDTLGFDARDVATYAALENAPDSVTVARLRKGAALKKGVTATGSGSPGTVDRKASTSSAFPVVLGVGKQGDRVALAQRGATLKSWTDGGKTMADHGELVDVAKVLDDRDVYAATLLDGPATGQLRVSSQALKGVTGMPAFDAVGIGQVVRGGNEVEYVAYRVDDADSAKGRIASVWRQGKSLLTGDPLTDLVTVTSVTGKDHVVVVELAPKSPGVAMQMLNRSDLPFTVLP